MPTRSTIFIAGYLVFLTTACCYAETVIGTEDTLYINSLLRKGIALKHDHPDSALYYYQQVYEHPKAEQISSLSEISELDKAFIITVIQALNYAGNIYYYDDEYARSEYYYKRSLELARAAGLKEYTARAFFDLGYVRYVVNDYETAEAYFERSYELYEDAAIESGMYDALHACGLTNRRLGEVEEADSCFRKALQMAYLLQDSLLIADIKINSGILLCEQGSLEEGIELFEEALDQYEKAGNERAVSTALLNIGVVMKMVNEYDKALDYMKRSLEIEEVMQQKSQLAVRYYNMADLYLEMGENEKAYDYCQKILSVAGEIGSQPFRSECDFLLGKYYFLQKDYLKARQYFTLATDSANGTTNKPLLTNIYIWLGKTYLGQGEYDRAIRSALTAYELAQDMGLLSLQKEASYILYESHEKWDKPVEALNWHKKYLEHSDSISYFNQHKEIKAIESRYNYEKKAKENELLKNRASLQEQKLRNRTIVTITLIIIISFSVLLILLLFRRNRDAKMLYEQQQMLNLQHLQEIENELDGKKRELASKLMFLNHKNDLINRIIQRLQEIQDSSENSTDELNDIVSELRVESPQSNWKEFEAQFIQVHPDFYKRLFERHPELTSYEQRICAFLRMNLNSKEISAITGRSLKSIEVTRSRIRTKLKLSRKDNLNSYLASV
jgi:tetratricopeptide (TPR) repeat protein